MPKSTDLLSGRICSSSPLFKGMYDCAHMNKEVASEKGKIVDYSPAAGNGSLSNVCSVIAPYMGKAGSSVYNKLTQGSHSDLLENALAAGDLAYEKNSSITPAELGKVIGDQLLIELKENGIKSGKGHASNGTNPRPAAAKNSIPTVTEIDPTSLILPPNPDTDPEYKRLLENVAAAQKKSNELLNDPNADPTEGWNAMLALKAAQKAVVDYAKSHADYTQLTKKIDELEERIMEDEISHCDLWNRIQSLSEKAARYVKDRIACEAMLKKFKAALPASEK